MDASTIIAIAIIFLLLCIFGTVGGLLAYLGMFREILIKVGKPPVQKFRGYYKFARGDYKESGGLYEQANKLAPELRTFGVYYDDPNETGATLRRYIVGSIVEEDGTPALKDVERLEQLEEALKSGGFKESDFPGVQNAAFVEFPWRTSFSVWVAVNRVYGALHNFLKGSQLDHGPFMEVYDRLGEKMYFIAPLEKFDDFYVLECLEANMDEDFEDLSPESGNEEAEEEEERESKEDSHKKDR